MTNHWSNHKVPVSGLIPEERYYIVVYNLDLHTLSNPPRTFIGTFYRRSYSYLNGRQYPACIFKYVEISITDGYFGLNEYASYNCYVLSTSKNEYYPMKAQNIILRQQIRNWCLLHSYGLELLGIKKNIPPDIQNIIAQFLNVKTFVNI